MDFIDVARMLHNKEIIDNHPDFIEQGGIPMVIYTLNQSIRPNIFNYHVFIKDLNITSFAENYNTVPCACSKFDPSYIDRNHQHILTGDLGIISRLNLKNLIPKVLDTENLLIYPDKKPKHRLPLV